TQGPSAHRRVLPGVAGGHLHGPRQVRAVRGGPARQERGRWLQRGGGVVDEELRHPDEWAELHGFRILDPDGWRGPYADIEYDTPITEEEFMRRATVCTIQPLRPRAWFDIGRKD